MSDTKLKTPPRTMLQMLWQEFLFTKRFTLQTPLSPYEVIEKLNGLSHPRQGWLYPVNKQVDVSLNIEGHYAFTIRLQRTSRGIPYTMAQVNGEIQPDGLHTQLDGYARFGAFYHVFLFVYTVVMILIYMSLRFWMQANASLFLIIIVAFLLLGWWRMLTDRNSLLGEMISALDPDSQQKQKR